MTDEELTEYLHLTPEQAQKILPRLTPERRATFVKMKEIEDWANNGRRGPRPHALMDFDE